MEPDNVRNRIHQDFLRDHDRPWKGYTLDLVFPPLHHSDKSPLPCRETPEELEAATRQFSAGTRELFEGLESLQFYIEWHKRRTKGHKPLIHPDGLDLTIRIHGQHITVPYDEEPLSCLHRVYHSRRLRLLPGDLAALPRLHWITKLTIEPAAEYDEAMTHFAGARPVSPLARMPDLVYPAVVDPVSARLRAPAARLEVLDLRAMTKEDEEVDKDYYDDVSGFGNGYEHDARKRDLFRIKPVTEKVEPLLAAFGEALRGMASLEGAELFAWLTWQPSDERAQDYWGDGLCDDNRRSWKWGVRYIHAKDGTKGRVEWQVGDWRPEENIITLFKSLGGDGGIDVIWKPSDKKDGRETWKDDELW
ncbi:hypothetical protein FJTKL_12046 [Diaporthe vaccinii]|uniref:Uncharacterized protein n=1 Tax=Diaporthe vaccinii TaxID=105482 RepID=A0ABR4FB07_9PEZI